jgi:short-subunit dehydrogenase
MKVKNKVIIVTGGGSGMGRELVLNLLDKEAKVAAIDINGDTLNETVDLAKSSADSLKTFVLDITNRAKVVETIAQIIKAFGTVDGIINNAGIIQPFKKVNDLDFDTIDRVMNINFYGTLFLIKAILPHLMIRPEAHIVNISSMGGFLPVPGQSIYGASKAAVKLLTEGLYSELAETNVKVSVVFPGAVATKITENSGLAKPTKNNNNHGKIKLLPAYDAAKIIIDGMEKNSYRILVGNDAKFLDLYSRFYPKSAARFISKKMRSLL